MCYPAAHRRKQAPRLCGCAVLAHARRLGRGIGSYDVLVLLHSHGPALLDSREGLGWGRAVIHIKQHLDSGSGGQAAARTCSEGSRICSAWTKKASTSLQMYGCRQGADSGSGLAGWSRQRWRQRRRRQQRHMCSQAPIRYLHATCRPRSHQWSTNWPPEGTESGDPSLKSSAGSSRPHSSIVTEPRRCLCARSSQTHQKVATRSPGVPAGAAMAAAAAWQPSLI